LEDRIGKKLLKDGEENAVVKWDVRPWNPTKKDIERWLETKQLKFVKKYNRISRYTPLQYLERYVFTDLHETFFCYFPELLQELILRLKDNHPTNWIRLVEWTTENIACL
jgi:hypothetical protein